MLAALGPPLLVVPLDVGTLLGPFEAAELGPPLGTVPVVAGRLGCVAGAPLSVNLGGSALPGLIKPPRLALPGNLMNSVCGG